ncbi:MAG: tRNA pseudouridine(55) synthase TruB [Caldilineaceae bacterium]|nr:tRNA pseudouridine(55) synthase TruB [Caldilineaceae bacterium]
MTRRESHLHGLLIVDKPGLQELLGQAGQALPADLPRSASDQLSEEEMPRLYTSHDVVQRVRRWSGQRRIGHTGTLDPMASGVLVLCLGQATRLVEYYQGHDKTYYAEVKLGAATDTYDAVGQVVETAAVPSLTNTQIEHALARFRGDILQQPPVYSALKQGGESLHRKARRGETVTVAPRPVTIHSLELLDFQAPDRLCLRVICSAGTYIRSLAHDLGRALNSCAHLTLLRREAAGFFTLADSQPLGAIEAAAQADTFEHLLLPAGTHLAMPELLVDAEVAKVLGQGQKVYLPASTKPVSVQAGETPAALAKIVTNDARFLGIGRCLKQNKLSSEHHAGETLWKAEKWLANPTP